MKPKDKGLYARTMTLARAARTKAAMMLLVSVFTALTANARSFVTDVLLIGGDYRNGANVYNLRQEYMANGWICTETDLNHATTKDGDYILLFYKTAESPDGFNHGYITDFYLSNADGNGPETYTVDGRTYQRVPCAGGNDFINSKGDLNNDAGGDYIHLYYTMDVFSDGRAVTGITIDNQQDGALGVNGGDTGYDLNSGAGGAFIYMHVSSHFTADCTEAVNLSNDGDEYYVNMPAYITNTLSIPSDVQSFKVYDDGGKWGKYSDDCDGYLKLTAPEGKVLQMTGIVNVSLYDDQLSVYDGNSTASPRIILADSYDIDIGTVVSTGREVLFYFKSTKWHSMSGFDITVKVVDPNEKFNVTVDNSGGGGTATATPTLTTAGQTVTVTGTPAEDYVLTHFSVMDGNNQSYSIPDVTNSWREGNTVTFTMPGTDVTVIPTFTYKCTADKGLYINMPRKDSKTVSIPSGVHSLKVYNDGDKYGFYGDFCDGYLTLTAPENYVLQLTGSVETERGNDYLTVYDGTSTEANKLLDKMSSNLNDGQTTDIGTHFSTGRSIMLYFHSNYDTNKFRGIDLTVTLWSTDTKYNITVDNPPKGGIMNSPAEASVIQPITLTASPSTGYLLSDISVVDGNSNPVSINWTTFTNTATFTMPPSSVTVTPTFTDNWTADGGLYSKMPVTGTTTVSIPSGVQSFKVYDDGGSTGKYSNYCDGYLILTAPEGYVLQLTGSVETERTLDYLNVYDGTSTEANKLLDKVTAVIYSGERIDIGTLFSTGRSIMLYFHSNLSTENYNGLDLTVTLKNFEDISLADNADNSTTISGHDGYLANVTLSGRTLYRNGKWNTLCLPFNTTKTGALDKAIIKEIDTKTAYNGYKTGLDGNTLYLNFKDAKSIEAGKPYIVKWEIDEQIFNPSDEYTAALGFISEVPTYDNGQASNWDANTEGPAKLVDGNTGTKYGLDNANPWVEFHYVSAITPKGYALWTAGDSDGARNPTSWTIKAKNSLFAAWTTLGTVDNTNGDKLPLANNTCTIFPLDNNTAYQYFRFEATKGDAFQLAELQFCTVQPVIPLPSNIDSPVFTQVIINASAPSAVTSEDGKVSFVGSYSPVALTPNDKSNLFLGGANTLYYPNAANNADGYYYVNACRAFFSLDPNATVKEFKLNFEDSEDATSIDSLTPALSKGEGDIYNLAGQRLSKMQHGIYIVNGKKVLK